MTLGFVQVKNYYNKNPPIILYIMADLSTKQKILNTSIRLFNEDGMANVPLQQIAKEIGISPGNLAYHFKNKEAIIEAMMMRSCIRKPMKSYPPIEFFRISSILIINSISIFLSFKNILFTFWICCK
jgi:hypothetical protein